MRLLYCYYVLMARNKRYKFNPETLTYEIHKTPFSTKFLKTTLYFALSLMAFGAYFLLYTEVLGLETPKHSILAKYYRDGHSKLEMLNTRFENTNKVLNELQMRDNMVYRPIFGMEEISSDVRNAGYGGTERFSYLNGRDFSGLLTATSQTINILTKKAYVQSKSFDDVSMLSAKAGELALSVPNICPVYRDNVFLSSSFGYRKDPIKGFSKMHSGMDFSGKQGEAIFVTGNGKVTKIGYDFFGYGNFIIVDHGFGYKTRYAHLKAMLVTEGQTVHRGEQIAEMGNTGRSTGTHLHYEVIYMSKPVNPINYFDLNISSEDYASMVRPMSGSHI